MEVTVISIISGVQDGKFESFMILHRIFTEVLLNQFLESQLPVIGIFVPIFVPSEDDLVSTLSPRPCRFHMHHLLFREIRTRLCLILIAKKLEDLRQAWLTHPCLGIYRYLLILRQRGSNVKWRRAKINQLGTQ